MKRVALAVLLAACGGREQKAPPQTVTLPQPADAGATSMVGDTIGEEPRANPVSGSDDAGAVGTLPRAVIQKVVRASLDRTKLCYETALRSDANLKGRVTTRFVIDPTGRVSSAKSTDQSTMPNADVVACVVAVFESLQFPKPEGGGRVIVVYPLVFQAAVDSDD